VLKALRGLRAGLLAGLATVVAAVGPGAREAQAADPVRHHAQSLIGAVKYGPDFKNFGWVNPDAPKGGVVRQFVQGSFDSLNGFTVQGRPAKDLGLIYDQLFESSPDEPGSQYGLLAEWVSYPDDFSSVTFGLRAGAKFHDGEPVKPEDVIFSMMAQKKSHPRYELYYKNVVSGEKTGEREVTFKFDTTGNRELPFIVGELTVLPKHYWTAKGANGEPRDLAKSTVEIPLGSGPYKIKSVDPTRGITYERVAEYWAKDLPVNVGQNNFGEVRFTYFRDRTPAFEAFKSGGLDLWVENSASGWATQYSFDAVTKGLVKKEQLPIQRVAPMQVFAFNTRRAKFQDVRVRKALNLVYNFEEANKKLFFESYTRTASFFDNSELKASGLPQGRELELLSELKSELPPEVFTTEWKNAVNTPENRRANMSEAAKLFAAAGWTQKNGALVNAAGEDFNVEFLIDNETLQRVIIPYIEDLKLLGVKATIRLVDSSQYKRREDDRDFDVIIDNVSQSISPGNEQREFWGTASADQNGSRNTIGIKNKAIDKLIDKIVFATDRAELIAATRAMDRVLLWNYYVVPQWHLPAERLAYWDIFGRPATLPKQTVAYQRVWWVDPMKQAALATARGQ
jgi:microcin C transport system substrate-binding protein